ncbi:phage tail protein [Acinetobacter sp. YH16057]|uniref:phage tail protein n=1 Tax=Acinetobacter sp. YH16057 TaxID=2601195 RepID=UPI00211E9F4A|nr:phage tail protein [Acinetobacter sp. YH16057]
MAKKKKQTIGYKYFASAHFVLCHGPIDAITKISFQDKDAYLNEENANKTIYINKPSLFGGDEQSGGVQGNIELLFGHADQQKSSVLQRICAKISNAFGGLISAYRGVCSVVFDNVYIGTAPNMPDSKWRVKRIHTRHDGQAQWYDEKAEITGKVFIGDVENYSFNLSHIYRVETNQYPTGIEVFDKVEYCQFIGSSNPFYYFSLSPGDGAIGYARARHTFIFAKEIEIIASLTITSATHYEYEFNTSAIVIQSSESTSEHSTRTNTYELKLKTGDYIEAFTGYGNNISLNVTMGMRDVKLVPPLYKDADVNPAHIIHEILTNQVWGIGVSESNVDNVSFKNAADTLYIEQMGMSIKWTDSTSINEFVDNIKEHINAQLYLDRVTNKWNLYLIRDDYDVADLISLDESNIRNLDFERRTLAECVNSVTVTYWDRERGKDSTVTVQDIARIAQQGGVISQSIDYKGFTNSDLASRVALRELKTLSSTLASVSFDVDESFSEPWHEGMPFKLSDDSYGLSEAVMRIRTIKRGDGINNTVYVEAIEDSFSSPMQSVVEYVPPITSGDSTAQDATAIAFEVPYIELVEQYGQDEVDAKLSNYPELGYVGMAAIRPNNQHVNAGLYVNAGAGYDERTTLDFCPSAQLKAEIGYFDSSFEVQNVAEFELLEANHRIQVDDEIMAFVGFDAVTNVITVKRGCFDTLPQKHGVGSKIFGWDNYSGIDDIEYLSGEIVSMKVLTLTGSDILELGGAYVHSVTLSARAIRPYPPAKVKINGIFYPESLIAIADISVSWVGRNRLIQTGGEPLGFFDNGVSGEDGTTYSIELSTVNDGVLLVEADLILNEYLIPLSVIQPYKAHTLKIWATRGGYDSAVFEHSFFAETASLILSATTDGSSVTGNTVPLANVEADVDESLKARVVYDGNSVKGKAAAGSIITIEIEE